MAQISGLSSPTSASDSVTKKYVDREVTWLDMLHNFGYAPIHDPLFAEIEQIFGEVGLKFIQVAAYSTESLPYGTTPQTAQCITRHHRLLVNLIQCKLTICVDAHFSMYTLPGLARIFSIHEPTFFLELAQYLRKERVLSLPKYWFVRLKLWWNK